MNKGKLIFIRLSSVLVLAASFFLLSSCNKKQEKVVKIGLLHSTTGSMAISEEIVLQAELLAVKELNAVGGVLGHKIEVIQENGESNPAVFAEKARKLIEEDKVATIFGCWTSDSRKAVKTVVEEHYSLLWYPVQYEGMEASPNIMYTGACPNQQVVPALNYCAETYGKRKFLIGSDYVFPQIANNIIKAQLEYLDGDCVGEVYFPMEENNFHAIIKQIKEINPDIIINTLNGESNVYFFNQLYEAGISANDIPVMSFSIAENEVNHIGVEKLEGHLVSWNYYETTDTNKNHRFVDTFKNEYGTEEKVDDPAEAGYIAVILWAAACEKAGSFDVEAVRIAAKGLSYIAPEGLVTIEGSNQHLNKIVRIGKVFPNGQIYEIWSTKSTVRPDPYLSTYDWARGL